MLMVITLVGIIWLLIPVCVILYLLYEAFKREINYPEDIKPTTHLKGETGIVTRTIVPGEYGQNSGQIRIGKKKHRAVSEEKIEKGVRVRVVKAEGITLSVEEISDNLEI